MSIPFKIPLYVKATLIPLGLISFIGLLYILRGILVPFIYSTIIAIVLSPFVNYLVEKIKNRVIAITCILTVAIISSVSIFIMLSLQLSMFSESFPILISKFHILMLQTELWISHNFNISTFSINIWIDETNVEILNRSRSLIGSTLINIGNLLVVMVLIPVYIFMILFYQPLIIEFIHKLFSLNKLETLNEVLNTSKKIIQSYLVGLLLEALIIAILNSSTLLIIGIDYAILLGVIGALINVIPYLGGIIAVSLPMIIAFATKTPTHALLVLTSYILIQFIDNHFIIPKIVASKVKINALVSVFVVLAGGALWGIPGMFLSIPLTAILKVICDHIEVLKPWGFLLGNIVPTTQKSIFIKLTNK